MNKKSIKRWSGECLRKSRFGTQERAEKSIKKIKKTSGNQLYSYMCEHCMGWHLTKRLKKNY